MSPTPSSVGLSSCTTCGSTVAGTNSSESDCDCFSSVLVAAEQFSDCFGSWRVGYSDGPRCSNQVKCCFKLFLVIETVHFLSPMLCASLSVGMGLLFVDLDDDSLDDHNRSPVDACWARLHVTSRRGQRRGGKATRTQWDVHSGEILAWMAAMERF